MGKYSELKIIDNPKQWYLDFEQGWLSNYAQTGNHDWNLYNHLENQFAPVGKGIPQKNIKLILITASGAFHPATQSPFMSATPFEDLSIRRLNNDIHFEELSFSEHSLSNISLMIKSRIFFPVNLLREISKAGTIHSIAKETISLNGEIPNVLRIEKELLPKILDVIDQNQANAALLVSSSHLSTQTVMLLARGLELWKIPSVVIGADLTDYAKILPPRALYVGNIKNNLQLENIELQKHKKVLLKAINMLTKDAPLKLEIF